MCTYATHQCAVTGSGKSTAGWFPVSTATVYVDHPVHAYADHTLNIDFAGCGRETVARVAVELHARSALALVSTVAAALLSAPAEITGLGEGDRSRLALLLSDDSSERDRAAEL